METQTKTETVTLRMVQTMLLATLLALIVLAFFLIRPAAAFDGPAAERAFIWEGDFTEKGDTLENIVDGIYFREQTVFAPLAPDGRTVDYVDVERYLGKWYEIATYEQRFQKGCTGTTATYGLNENGTIGVLNECYRGSLDGRYTAAQATARVVDKETNAKLRVYFVPIFGAPYWIIELDGTGGDEPYEWAVVGSVFKSYLWILSRTPQMSEERLNAILDRLEQRGYDISKLSFTIQPE